MENLRAPEQNVEWQDPDGDEYDHDYDDYDDTEVEEENRDSGEDQDEDGDQSSDIEDGLNYYGGDQDENEDLISGEMGEDIDAYEEDEGGIFERDPDEDEDQMSDEMKGTESEVGRRCWLSMQKLILCRSPRRVCRLPLAMLPSTTRGAGMRLGRIAIRSSKITSSLQSM
jgi:hypothetical protein